MCYWPARVNVGATHILSVISCIVHQLRRDLIVSIWKTHRCAARLLTRLCRGRPVRSLKLVGWINYNAEVELSFLLKFSLNWMLFGQTTSQA
jgi:hypothetical protein